jgi:ABC-2 type transport system permease protein
MTAQVEAVRSPTAVAGLAGRRAGPPWWTGFTATFVQQVKQFYREPAALVFTLGMPVMLLLILNAFNFHVTLPNGGERPYLDRLLPGMIAFTGMTVGLNSVAFGLSREKERGVLRRLAATPLPTASFVAGVMASRLVIALLVTLITWATGVYGFGAEVNGSVAGLVVLAMLGATVFIAFGILIVALARSEDDIPPLFILMILPSLLFSGAFLDRSGLADWLQWITGGLPLTFLTHAVQQVANLGGGFDAVRGDLIGLGVWVTLAASAAAWRFRMTT